MSQKKIERGDPLRYNDFPSSDLEAKENTTLPAGAGMTRLEPFDIYIVELKTFHLIPHLTKETVHNIFYILEIKFLQRM